MNISQQYFPASYSPYPVQRNRGSAANVSATVQHSWNIVCLENANKMVYYKNTGKQSSYSEEYGNNGFREGSKQNLTYANLEDGRDISVGCAKFAELADYYDIDNNLSGECVRIEVTSKANKSILTFWSVDIRSKSKIVEQTLCNNGVTFFGNGFRLWCDWIARNMECSTVTRYVTDYYYDEGNTLHHANESNIMLNAAEVPDILNRLEIRLDHPVRRAEFQTLTLMLYGVSAKLTTLLKHLGISGAAKLAFVHRDIQAASEELQRLFCTREQPIVPLKKGYEAKLPRYYNMVCLMGTVDSESSYMIDKHIRSVGEMTGYASLPVLVAKDPDLFKGNDDFLCLNYEVTGIGNIENIMCWGQSQFFKEKGLDEKFKQTFLRYEGSLDEVETTALRRLTAMLLAMAETLLPKLGITNDRICTVVDEYRSYLINSMYSYADIVIERVKQYLCSERDIPLYRREEYPYMEELALYLYNNMILFSRDVMLRIADHSCMSGSAFVNTLYGAGMLIHDKGNKYLCNIHMPGKTSKRMYSLNLDKLFGYGELRPGCADENQPDIKIPIGVGDNDTELYFTIGKGGSKDNSFAYICGKSGCGKTTLVKTIMNGAVKQNMAVVNICLMDSDYRSGREYKMFMVPDQSSLSTDVRINNLLDLMRDTGLTDKQQELLNTAADIIGDKAYSSLSECADEILDCIVGEPGSEMLGTVVSMAVQAHESFGKYLNWFEADVPGKLSQIIVKDKKAADELLSEFYDFKVQQTRSGHDSYTLLVLDEAQDLLWNPESALVSKILRKGRKHGIVGIISSQFLNSDNASNMKSALGQLNTNFVFSPSDEQYALHFLKSDSRSAAKEELKRLGVGETIACGNIATKDYRIDYPVKIRVYNEAGK